MYVINYYEPLFQYSSIPSDQCHQSHNAPVPDPRCTILKHKCAHFRSKDLKVVWDMGRVHCGNSESGLLPSTICDLLCFVVISWWRHQMETFSALLALCAGNSPVTGEFPSQRPVTRSFHVFFDLPLNKRLSKQPCSWWFETPTCPLWRHSNIGTAL